MNLPRPASILIAALLATLLAVPAASSASSPRPTLPTVGAGHAVGGGHGRAAKIRHRRAQRSTAAVAPAVAVKEAAASTSAAPAPALGNNPGVLFDGNFDGGFGSWYVQSLDDRATLFSSGAFQGSQAARFEVQAADVEPDTGSRRSEVSGPTFNEGEDLYIRDAIRAATRTPRPGRSSSSCTRKTGAARRGWP